MKDRGHTRAGSVTQERVVSMLALALFCVALPAGAPPSQRSRGGLEILGAPGDENLAGLARPKFSSRTAPGDPGGLQGDRGTWEGSASRVIELYSSCA